MLKNQKQQIAPSSMELARNEPMLLNWAASTHAVVEHGGAKKSPFLRCVSA